MSALTFIQFAAGLALLIAGAESLVRGASRLAIALGISPLVVGLTVVAYGTSAPELAVGISSALGGGPGADLAIGNVVGSNVFNVLFILGVSAWIAPLVVAARLVRFDVPLLIGLSAFTWWCAATGLRITRFEGAVLLLGGLAYTLFLIVQSRRETAAGAFETEHGPAKAARGRTAVNLLLIAAGLALLVLGSRWLVESATAFARAFGMSELVIGLTIVAAGTSLPEVATSVLAALRGERDIAVGNVIGSCIFNLLVVLGATSLVAPEGLRVALAALDFDVPVMLATAIACLPIFFTGHRIARWEGALFLGYYLAYTAWLILYAREHDAIATLGPALRWFLLPLTAVTLAVLAVMEWRRRRGRAG